MIEKKSDIVQNNSDRWNKTICNRRLHRDWLLRKIREEVVKESKQEQRILADRKAFS